MSLYDLALSNLPQHPSPPLIQIFWLRHWFVLVPHHAKVMGKVVELDATELEVIALATPKAVHAKRRCAWWREVLDHRWVLLPISSAVCVHVQNVGYKHLNYLQSCTLVSTISHIYMFCHLTKFYITILCMYAKFWFRDLMQNYQQNYHSVLRIYIYHKKWQTHRYFNLEITMHVQGRWRASN